MGICIVFIARNLRYPLSLEDWTAAPSFVDPIHRHLNADVRGQRRLDSKGAGVLSSSASRAERKVTAMRAKLKNQDKMNAKQKKKETKVAAAAMCF